MQRLLCGYSRKEHEKITRIYQKSIEKDKEAEQLIWIFIKVFSSIDYIVKL